MRTWPPLDLVAQLTGDVGEGARADEGEGVVGAPCPRSRRSPDRSILSVPPTKSMIVSASAPVPASPPAIHLNVSTPPLPVSWFAAWLAISVSLPTPPIAFSISERGIALEQQRIGDVAAGEMAAAPRLASWLRPMRRPFAGPQVDRHRRRRSWTDRRCRCRRRPRSVRKMRLRARRALAGAVDQHLAGGRAPACRPCCRCW